MSRNPSIQSVSAGLLDAALYTEDGSGEAARPPRAALFLAISRAFDLAGDQPAGHAPRVAFAATGIAAEMGFEAAAIRDLLFASLVHDVGVTLSGSAGDAAWASGGEGDPARLGASYARRLGLGERAARAIADHTRSADGLGGDVSPLGAVLTVASRFEGLLAEPLSPLSLRRRVPAQLAALQPADGGGAMAGAVDAMLALISRDTFWLALYDNDLASHLAPLDGGRSLDLDELSAIAMVIAEIVDIRNRRDQDHSLRIAALAQDLARACSVSGDAGMLVRIAALLQDIGTLGIPADVLGKPDIFTLEEMSMVQKHPVIARDLLSEVPGLGAVAWWAGCHHERIDGRGYPGGLRGEDVPLEAQCIGLAETYWAMRSVRPYRAAMDHDAVMEVIEGMAGARFDPHLVGKLSALVQRRGEVQ